MSQPRTFTKKALLSLGAVGVAASMAGLGTFATFNDSTSASQAIASGTVDVNLGTAGSADNRLTIGASGLVPGDTVQRRAKVTNAGSENLASVVLTTVDTTIDPDTVLTTDATNGLQMKIERCTGTVGWTESVTTPYTYTCDAVLAGDNAGVRSAVLASRAVIGADLALSGMQSVTAGSTDDMVVTLSLPTTADNDFQGKSATIEYTFAGTQRNGASK